MMNFCNKQFKIILFYIFKTWGGGGYEEANVGYKKREKTSEGTTV
jgi:hypothetical protein